MADDPDSHESPLRRLMAESDGRGYESFGTLDATKADPEGVAVLEGDLGGQLYVVVGADRVACSEETLEQLLRDLDAICWPGNDADMARVVYERRAQGAPVPGGMGGAVVTGDVWIHHELEQLGLADEIRAVVDGRAPRLSSKRQARRLP
jgi:hypothetical protein